MALLGKRHARGPVCGELLIFDTNQQFATDRPRANFRTSSEVPAACVIVELR